MKKESNHILFNQVNAWNAWEFKSCIYVYHQEFIYAQTLF